MKLYTAVQYLLADNEKLKFLACTFDTSAKRYTYKALFDVEVGDKIIVNTNSGLQIVVVREVLQVEDIDFDAFEIKWAVSKVDFETYEKSVQMEEDVTKMLRSRQRKSVVETAMQGMLDDDERQAVKALVRL